MSALLQALAVVAALGSLMPPLVAVVVRAKWPGPAKAAVAVVSSALIGVAGAAMTHQFDGLGWIPCIAAAVVASQATYAKFWHGSGIAPWIESNVLAGAAPDDQR